MLLYHIYMRRFSSGAVAADHSKIPPYYKIIPQAPGGNDDSVLSFHSPAPPKQIPPQPAQVPSFTNGSAIQLQTARSRYIVFSI